MCNAQKEVWPKQAFPSQLSNTPLNIASEHLRPPGPASKSELEVAHAVWEKEARGGGGSL